MRPTTLFSADLVTFTEEIYNGKLYFLCSVGMEIPPMVLGHHNQG